MEKNDNFNKLQWSGAYGGKMYVVRSNDEDEFDKLVGKYEKIVDDKVQPPMNTVDEKLDNFVKDYESANNVCPKCGQALIAGTTKNGKNYMKCSTNKWDRELKRATGCDYIRWL